LGLEGNSKSLTLIRMAHLSLMNLRRL